MKRILKFIGCLALGCVGLTTLADTVAKIEGKGEYETLAAAFEAVESGDTLEIVKAGEYPVSALPGDGYTLKATVDGVKFAGPNTGYAQIAWGKTAGIVLSNVTWNVGTAGYQYWGKVQSYDCKFIGLLFCGQGAYFEGCQFEQSASDYHAWAYGACSFKDCTFTNPMTGKFINVYNEGSTVYPVSFIGCKFINTAAEAKKAALNVKATCGSVGLGSVVTVEDCSVEGPFPSASTSASLIVFNGVVQLDDIKANVPCTVSITQDGRVIYKDNAPIPEPITVKVEKDETKGIDDAVVTEISKNKEVGKLEETGLKEALPAEELEEGGEPVIKVELQEVAANTLKFDVSPYVGEKKVDSNTLNGKPVAVRLPLVEAKFDGEYAKVIHEGDPIRFVLVKKGATGAYVDLTLTHFSEIDVLLAQAEELVHAVDPSAVQIQPGLWGANGVTDMGHAEIVYSVGATGLKAFRDWVNDGHSGEGQTFKLVADVDLGNENWTPIATSKSLSFKGTFDGVGHTISSLKIEGDPAVDMDIGLFGYITTGACLKNFTVDGSVVVKFLDGSKGNGGGAGVVGYMTGGTVDSVTNRASVSSAGTYGRLGGICGIAKSAEARIYIKNCANYGNIVHEFNVVVQGGYCGGIVSQSQSLLSLVDCVNYGSIKGGRYNDGSKVVISLGGIIANIGKDDDTAHWPVEMVRCVNYGIVGGDTYAQDIGGLIGKKHEHTERLGIEGLHLTDCANYGVVSSAIDSLGEIGGAMCSGTRCVWNVTGTLTARKGKVLAHNNAVTRFKGIVTTCPGVAKDINGNDIDVDIYYTSIAGAIAAAKAGDTVKLFSASSENFTLPVGVTFDATGAAYTGTISAPDGYFVKEVSTKVYECKPAVAQIGTTIYSSFKEAYDATVDGDTITILADFALKEAFKLGVVDRNNLIIDLNGKTMTLNSVVSTQYKNLTFKNGAIDIGVPAGGQAGEHAWDKLFYVESCELKFLNVTLTYTNGVSTVGIQTGGTAKLAFKDSMLNFANCDKPVYLGTPGDCVFDHTVISADKATTYVVHGDYNCGPVIFKGGSSVTMKDCGGLNSNSTFEMSDTTVNATGLKNPLFRDSSVTLVSNAKIFVDGAANMFGYNAYELVVNAGCTFELRNCGYTGAIFNRGGSVFKSGSTVVISNCCVTENTTHACYGKDNAIRAYGDLTIEDGADVRLYGTIDAFSGPGTITIADGRYTKLVQTVATEKFDLKGGLYKTKPEDAFVNPYYEAVANTNATTLAEGYEWMIAKKPSVAEILDAESQSLGEIYAFELALAQVPTNGTIKILVNDASFAITDTGKSFKIDPNTHTLGEITVPTGYELKNNAGVLTFRKIPIATITRVSVTTEYATLPEACAAAQSGDVIQLAALEIDATGEYVIKDLTGKTVTVKGAGQDKTTLLMGTGFKRGTDGAGSVNGYLTGANITFEDVSMDYNHGGVAMPNGQQMLLHPASQTYRNVRILGAIETTDPALFEGCTFAGPVHAATDANASKYMLWVYARNAVVTNCTFEQNGQAYVKLYNDANLACTVKIVDTTFQGVCGDKKCVVNSSNIGTEIYDVQFGESNVFPDDIPVAVAADKASVTVVNGAKDANGKYTSGALIAKDLTAEKVATFASAHVADEFTTLAYAGDPTKLCDFAWYVGPQQLTPKTDTAVAEASDEEKANVPTEVEDRDQKISDAVNQTKTDVSAAATSGEVTHFGETGLADAVVNPNGSLDERVIAALQGTVGLTPEQKEIIAEFSSDSNSTKRIDIELKKIDVGLEVSGQNVVGSANKVIYDVVPRVKTVIEVKDDEGALLKHVESEAQVPNETIADNPITFRLGVTWAIGTQVKVLREGVIFGITNVEGAGDKRYVELTSNHFCEFTLLQVNAATVCEVGGVAFESVADALTANAENSTAVIKLTETCGEENLPLKWGQEIDLNGQQFTGSITPVAEPGSVFDASDYEQVKTPAGRVFSAPTQTVVSVGAPEDNLSIKVRMLGYSAAELAENQGNGRPRWQNLAMGIGDVKLIPQVLRSDIGSKTITIRGNITDEAVEAAAKVRDGVSVQYQLMKKVGAGSYVQCGEIQPTPVFTVQADELEVQTFWKIQTIFSEEY